MDHALTHQTTAVCEDTGLPVPAGTVLAPVLFTLYTADLMQAPKGLVQSVLFLLFSDILLAGHLHVNMFSF